MYQSEIGERLKFARMLHETREEMKRKELPVKNRCKKCASELFALQVICSKCGEHI